MRIERVKIRNLGCLLEVDLDLDTLPQTARVVAVTGSNGAGKSTLLSLMVGGALFRDTGSRGSLVELSEWAGARDSMLEVSLRYEGRPYCIKHLIDGVAKTGSSVATNGDGSVVPACRDGKISLFDAWAAATFPAPEVLYASFVAQQRGDGLLDPNLTRGDRKAILLRALGVQKLEVLAEASRKRAQAAGDDAKVVEAKLQVERERAGDVVQAAVELEAAHYCLSGAQNQIAPLTAQVKQACSEVELVRQLDAEWHAKSDDAGRIRAELLRNQQRLADLSTRASEAAMQCADYRSTIAELDQQLPTLVADVERCSEWVTHEAEQQRIRREKAAQAEALRDRLNTLRDQIADLVTRVQNNEAVLLEAYVIRMAGLDREKFLARVRELEQSQLQLINQRAELTERAQFANARAVEAELVFHSHTSGAKRLEDELAAEAEVLRAVEQLPAAWADVERLSKELQEAEAELERLTGQRVAGSEERISGLRDGLRSIWLGELDGDTPKGRAADTLANDDQALRDASELPRAINCQCAKVGRAKAALVEAQAVERKLAQWAAIAPRMAEAKSGLAEVREVIEVSKERIAEQRATESELRFEASALQETLDAMQRETQEAKAAADALAAMAAKAGPLANAETRLSELRPQVETARSEWNSLRSDLDSVEGWLEENKEPDESAAADVLRFAENNLANANHFLSEARTALAAANATATELEPQIRAAQVSVGSLESSLQAIGEWLAQNSCPNLHAYADALQAAELALAQAQEEVTAATAAMAVAESRHSTAVEAAGRIEALTKQATELRQHQADWTLLARCLGRDGLQAALIDAAGPQLTEIANDLLHFCTGSSRFSVSFETTRQDAKGKRTIEDCEVRVFDADAGKWKIAKRLSGGELALVSLAVSLALTQLSCQRQGTRGATLIRDESGAALDAERAPQYVAMLRRSAAAIGADRVLLVSHVPEIISLCDARIELDSGTAKAYT